MWGAWACGPACPSSPDGALAHSQQPVPTPYCQPGPLTLPFPLCSGGTARRGWGVAPSC